MSLRGTSRYFYLSGAILIGAATGVAFHYPLSASAQVFAPSELARQGAGILSNFMATADAGAYANIFRTPAAAMVLGGPEVQAFLDTARSPGGVPAELVALYPNLSVVQASQGVYTSHGGQAFLETVSNRVLADRAVAAATTGTASRVANCPPPVGASRLTGVAATVNAAAPAQPVAEAVAAVDVASGAATTGAVPHMALSPLQTNPSHYQGQSVLAGEWEPTDEVLSGSFQGVSREKFGTTDIQLPFGATINVRDLHYRMPDGSIGMRIIPVSETGSFAGPGGAQIQKSDLMDQYVRELQGLGPTDPIFTYVAYLHPEFHSGTLEQLASEHLGTESRQTHLGMYIGQGRTLNSPGGYHGNSWGVGGHGQAYPATVQTVSMEGTPQAVLNQNGLNAAYVLNKGVKFPPDYKNDVFMTPSLKDTLAFYKGWLTDDPMYQTDKYATYCAEHVTITTNVALNVPHNEAAFKEIWGDQEGGQLWAKFKAKYKAATGKDFTSAQETSFEPLWKKEGITNPLESGENGVAMAWPAETTADLTANFVETYATWPRTGASISAATLLGFQPAITERTGLTQSKYLEMAVPVINAMYVGEAMTQRFENPAALEAWAKGKVGEAYLAVGGKVEDLGPGGTIDAKKMQLAESFLIGVGAEAANIMAQQGMSLENSYALFRENIAPALEAARQTDVSGPNAIKFISPPAVTSRVARGQHPTNRFVQIREVATAMDAAHVRLKP